VSVCGTANPPPPFPAGTLTVVRTRCRDSGMLAASAGFFALRGFFTWLLPGRDECLTAPAELCATAVPAPRPHTNTTAKIPNALRVLAAILSALPSVA
jgi:hypothetical protein